MTGQLRQPCGTCPWRITTPRGGFPGGKLEISGLRAMMRGDVLRAMQCHSTPDGMDAQVCAPLLTVRQLEVKHGTLRPRPCRTVCKGCTPSCPSARPRA